MEDKYTIGEKEYSREELLAFGKAHYPKFYWIYRGLGLGLLFFGISYALTYLLVAILLKFLKEHYPNALKERFGIENIGEPKDVLEDIANKRGLLAGSGRLDILKAESLLLKEFKDGLLGRISLEWL